MLSWRQEHLQSSCGNRDHHLHCKQHPGRAPSLPKAALDSTSCTHRACTQPGGQAGESSWDGQTGSSVTAAGGDAAALRLGRTRAPCMRDPPSLERSPINRLGVRPRSALVGPDTCHPTVQTPACGSTVRPHHECSVAPQISEAWPLQAAARAAGQPSFACGQRCLAGGKCTKVLQKVVAGNAGSKPIRLPTIHLQILSFRAQCAATTHFRTAAREQPCTAPPPLVSTPHKAQAPLQNEHGGQRTPLSSQVWPRRRPPRHTVAAPGVVEQRFSWCSNRAQPMAVTAARARERSSSEAGLMSAALPAASSSLCLRGAGGAGGEGWEP